MKPLSSAKKASNKSASWDFSGASSEELLALPIEELFARLRTSQSGLSSGEVENRLRIYGTNELAKRRRRTGVVEFLFHLSNPLIIILLLAGLISFSLGDKIGASIIFFIILLSVVLDVYQESKAERAAEVLKSKVATTATVEREGTKKEVRLVEIVLGDIVHLSAGDISPADARVINAKDLFVDQSALTGESFPVEKIASVLEQKVATLTEWNNCLFLGTSVVSGTATAVVIKTGKFTEYGKIAQNLVAREPETEFERGLRRFGSLMMQITILLVLFVFLVNSACEPYCSEQATYLRLCSSLLL